MAVTKQLPRSCSPHAADSCSGSPGHLHNCPELPRSCPEAAEKLFRGAMSGQCGPCSNLFGPMLGKVGHHLTKVGPPRQRFNNVWPKIDQGRSKLGQRWPKPDQVHQLLVNGNFPPPPHTPHPMPGPASCRWSPITPVMGTPPIEIGSDPIPPCLLLSPSCPPDASGAQNDGDAMPRSLLALRLTEAVSALLWCRAEIRIRRRISSCDPRLNSRIWPQVTCFGRKMAPNQTDTDTWGQPRSMLVEFGPNLEKVLDHGFAA